VRDVGGRLELRAGKLVCAVLRGRESRKALLLPDRQANELGGSVRKGEHSQIVVFWKVDQIANAGTETGAESDETDEGRRRFVLRYYRLFNLEQCELPQAVLDKLPKIETHQHDPIEAAERLKMNTFPLALSQRLEGEGERLWAGW
jgi:antirestriction protein ArdC